MAGRTSDHDPLHASIPFTALRQFPPLPPVAKPAEKDKPPPRLLPLTADVKEASRRSPRQLLADQGAQYGDLNQEELEQDVERYVRPHYGTESNTSAQTPPTHCHAT
jgi:hypothetical protein